jgi:hypothetical protein
MSATTSPTTSRPLSQSPILFYLGYGTSLIALGFGLNAFISPASALSWFELPPPSPENIAATELYQLMMQPYGARNIHVGITMFASAWYRQSKILGLAILSFAGVAIVDGVACFQRGEGEWNHWCYAPQLIILGSLLLGAFDGKKKIA